MRNLQLSAKLFCGIKQR